MVYGPGPAGGLPPSEVGNPDPPTINPGNPAPGLAYTSNLFIRDMGIDDIQDLLEVNEIAVPPGLPTTTWPSQRPWSPTTTSTRHSAFALIWRNRVCP
jgi:hypothetical protein